MQQLPAELHCGRCNGANTNRVLPFEQLTRLFLEREYKETLKILHGDSRLLKDIAETLIKDPVMDQDELSDICVNHGVAVNKS